MRRMAVAAFVTLATFAGALLVWSMRGAVLVLLLAIATAAALSPLVERLSARMPHPFAIALTYVTLVAALFAVGWVVVPPLVDEIGSAVEIGSAALARARDEWPHGSPLQRAVARGLDPSLERLRETSRDQYVAVARTALGATRTLVEVLGRGLLVLALSVYWSTSGDRVERFWLSLLDPRRRARLRRVWKDAECAVGRAVRRELGESLLTLLVLGVGLRFLDVRFWAIAAVSAAIVRLVPVVGVVLALPAVFVAALANGARAAMVATAFTLAVLVVEAAILHRRYAHPRGSAVLAVTTVLILADAWGIAGMLLGMPVAAALESLLARVPGAEPARAPVADLGELHARYRSLRQASRAASPEVASLVDRLGELLRRAHRLTGESERRTEAG